MTATSFEPMQDPLMDKHNPEHYRVGTLQYTKASLVTLFVYLLWGDFCWSLMETVMPSILPLKFKDIHADNKEIALIMTTIPSLMTTVLNPVISFQSDRFRSKWGRRIPFLMAVTPFLVIFLALLGFEESITPWVHRVILDGHYSPATVGLWVIGVLMVCFQFFNLFTQSVFYYLFNDVVPRAFLARFVALFRIAGGAAGIFYNAVIYQYAQLHMGLVFLGAALLYLVGYTMMCWKVKEGEYPPPPPYVDGEHGFVASVKTYILECYSHRFYWFIFLANSCQALTWVSGAFGLLLSTQYMGFSLAFLAGRSDHWPDWAIPELSRRHVGRPLQSTENHHLLCRGSAYAGTVFTVFCIFLATEYDASRSPAYADPAQLNWPAHRDCGGGQ